MYFRNTLARFIVNFLLAGSAYAMQVQFHPATQLYLHEANPQTGTYDVVAHLVLIRNDAAEKMTLGKVDYRFYAGEQMIQEIHVYPDQILAATNELIGFNQNGMKVLTDVILPPEVLGKNGKLASTKELASQEVLTVRNIYATLQAVPDRLHVHAFATNAQGKETEGTGEIPVVRYKSANVYKSPLQGAWYMQSIPNVTSHHRWMSQTEFGIDFLKVDSSGKLYRNDGKKPEDYFAFGEPVFAAADGTVVTVINDATQNWDAWIKREGETDEQFEKRSNQTHLEAMNRDLYRAVTGNLVVIEHASGEFSGYAHLKQGSVRVKVGDRLKQGDQIAQVGDTGDYYMAHLHFQISDRPDALHGRSLPFEFADIQTWNELGQFAKKKN